MLSFLYENLGTIAVLLVLIAAVAAIIACALRNKKSGKGSCSCGGNCGACGGCRTSGDCCGRDSADK